MKPQAKRLKDYLEAGFIVDPLTAWKELGIYNFSARLAEIRHDTPGLVSAWIEVKNKFGETVKVKAYHIERVAA